MTARAGDATSLAGAHAVQVSAPAKVNLRLRILAREESGYHQLETILLRLELGDTVRVRRSRTRSLVVSGSVDAASLGPVERNLAWRAAVAYGEAAGAKDGWSIELEKRIPVGGGLGGGSSDAAAVLRALDAISASPLGEPRLLAIAATLGADVPFLTSTSACALAWGRGERLLALTPPPQRDVLLLVPTFGVNTAEAYGWLSSGSEARNDTSVLLRGDSLATWDGLRSVAANDFEPVVAARHREIGVLVDALRAAGCAPAMMSGSGSVVFGVLPEGGSASLDVGVPCTLLTTRTAMRVEPVSALA